MSERDSITKTSALEQHAQTILAGLLTLAISSAVAISWRTSVQLERLLVLSEQQVKDSEAVARTLVSLDSRLDNAEARITRLEVKAEKYPSNGERPD